MQPRELPAKGNAPITLSSVTRIRTKDGSTPPTLEAIDFLIDKHGGVNSKAFPVCPRSKLEGATPPRRASVAPPPWSARGPARRW